MNILMKSSVRSLLGGEDGVCYDGVLATQFFLVLTVFAAAAAAFFWRYDSPHSPQAYLGKAKDKLNF